MVELGELLPSPFDASSPKWWPQAISPKVRSKLFRRISREGYVLTDLLSVSLALLSELYRTRSESDPATGQKSTRFRLRYQASPIADFGITAGKVAVTPQDRLAYIHESSNLWWKGQKPDDHYWLWFKTVSGHETTVECCMFTFNMCLIVSDAPYLLPSLAHMAGNYAPAFLKDRSVDKAILSLYDERKRLSVLRHKSLQGIAERSALGEPFGPEEEQIIASFMRKLAQPNTVFDPPEVHLVHPWSTFMRESLQECLSQGLYKRFPLYPPEGVETDLGEEFESEVIDEQWMKQMKKQYKKGEATREEISAMYREYQKKAQGPLYRPEDH